MNESIPAEASAKPVTGTVYALIDPRDETTQYIGQTKKQPIAARLAGGYAPRVRSWIAELRAAGLKPRIVPVREDVAAGDLLDAEADEITLIIAAGGTLLNEQVTAMGRKILSDRHKAEREAARRAAWTQVADAAIAVLGGPLPPGDLPLMEIPDVSWRFMSTGGPARVEHAKSLARSVRLPDISSEYEELQRVAEREQAEAADWLWRRARRAWGKVRGLGADSFDQCIERNTCAVLEARCDRRGDASRFLGLAVWYAVAVHPWRHLAELASLPMDDTSFIAWAGRDDEVREALSFLAARGDGMLAKLSVREHCPRNWTDPGHLLAAVAAAYSGAEPLEVIRSGLATTLGQYADDHMLTQPMADLLLRLNPRALDDVFGRDVAARMDRDLSLPEGTAGRVLRALDSYVGHVNDGAVRRAADRSTQVLPVTAVPDYGTWHGTGIPAARSVGACLVRAGLAEPDHATPEEYLAEVRALWTPNLEGITDEDGA